MGFQKYRFFGCTSPFFPRDYLPQGIILPFGNTRDCSRRSHQVQQILVLSDPSWRSIHISGLPLRQRVGRKIWKDSEMDDTNGHMALRSFLLHLAFQGIACRIALGCDRDGHDHHSLGSGAHVAGYLLSFPRVSSQVSKKRIRLPKKGTDSVPFFF